MYILLWAYLSTILVNNICSAKFTTVFLCHNIVLYDNSNDTLTTPSYCNDTHIIAGMYLVYSHFSDFNESYETLTNVCIQICLLTV